MKGLSAKVTDCTEVRLVMSLYLEHELKVTDRVAWVLRSKLPQSYTTNILLWPSTSVQGLGENSILLLKH